MTGPTAYEVVDYHTGGEPFRIVEASPAVLLQEGLTVADRRVVAAEDAGVQWVRGLLCSEPRGHADMYGGFLVPPDDDEADLGVLFWHKDGFSTACGHGTIALGVWAVESGRVAAPSDGETDVVIDVPSGRVRATVRIEAGQVTSARFTNVASYVLERTVPVHTSRGPVAVDIAYGGAMYAVLPAAAVGLTVSPGDLPALIATGREIRDRLNADGAAEHPSDPRLSGIYGTIFVEEVDATPAVEETHVAAARAAAGRTGARVLHQRNVTVFADGEVDRSPCGSGTSARMALLHASGELADGGVLLHESVVGSTFVGRVSRLTSAQGRAAVVPEVTGTAYATGEARFTVDPRDRLVPGFVLR